MKLTDKERQLLFDVEQKLREAKNMLVMFGGVVRGGFGGPHSVLKGTELHTLTGHLERLEGEVNSLAMLAGDDLEVAQVSQGVSCRCPRDLVVVMTRNANHSAFNGYHYTPSDYSRVVCTCCGATWRTKAGWVAKARDMTNAERGAWPPNQDHAQKCTHGRKTGQ